MKAEIARKSGSLETEA